MKQKLRMATSSVPPMKLDIHNAQTVHLSRGSGTWTQRAVDTCSFRTRLGSQQLGLDEESDSEEGHGRRLPLEYCFLPGRQTNLLPEDSECSAGEEEFDCEEDDGDDFNGALDNFDEDSIFGSHISATYSELLALESSVSEIFGASSNALPESDSSVVPGTENKENQHKTCPGERVVVSPPETDVSHDIEPTLAQEIDGFSTRVLDFEEPPIDSASNFYSIAEASWSVLTTMSAISTYMPGCVMEEAPSRFPRLADIVRVSSMAARKQLRKVESTCRGMMPPRKICAGGGT